MKFTEAFYNLSSINRTEVSFEKHILLFITETFKEATSIHNYVGMWQHNFYHCLKFDEMNSEICR